MNRFIKLGALFFLLLFNQISYSQLNNFSLTVTKTDETCTGNGALAFNVANTTSGSTIIYSIYLFPNLTTPITTLTTNTFTGLSSGNYRVVALQSLGSLNNSQQQDIQINNLIVPLLYNLAGQSVSCTNDGSITVTVTQGTPVTYEIISGPVIIAPQTSNVFSSLSAGSYNVRVNDACGDGVVQTFTVNATVSTPNFTISQPTINSSLNNCTSMQANFTISTLNINNILQYPLTAVFTVFPPNSGTPITLNQTITSGLSSSCQINLAFPYYENQIYYYNVSVTDACGKTITLNGQSIFRKLKLELSQQAKNSCLKQINLKISYFVSPITVNFLSYPSGFNPVIFNSNHPGPFIPIPNSSNDYIISYTSTDTVQIPSGLYLVSITDACGRTTQEQINLTNSMPDSLLYTIGNPCNPTTILNIPNLGPLVTSVIITNAPAELNYTFPYNVSSLIVAGQFQMVLPVAGVYYFSGTNVCGDTFSFTATVIPFIAATIGAEGYSNAGCNSSTGNVKLTMNGEPTLTNITLLQAPSNYNGTLPQNVSQFIVLPAKKTFLMQNLPLGNYVFSVTDSCGTIYNPVNVTVPINISQGPILVNFLKGCDENFCSLRLNSPNGPLQEVIITAAPANFSQPLPYNVSFNINGNGAFYMNSFPQGNYTFFTKDVCNAELTSPLLIPGYTVSNSVNIIPNCGSFNLDLQHIVNETFIHSYWLQKFNSITNQWGNPFTSVSYSSGLPNTTNSYQLQNLSINLNIAVTGTFRVVKAHYIHANGNPGYNLCIDIIKTFDFNGDLKIISANTFPCSNGINEVIVSAEGVAPLQYKITTKNGVAFVVDNGTSNIFNGLAPAIYNFQVKDLCGNIVNRIFDINLLPEPTIAPSNLCEGQNGQLSVQAISYLNYQWWKGTDTTNILSTTNVLTFNPFSTATTPGTYYVRIYSTNPLSCANKIVSYVVPAISNPNAGQNRDISICDSANPIDLFSILVAPFDTGGNWTETTNSGTLNANIWSPIGVIYGTYIFKYTVAGFCGAVDEAIVTLNFTQGPPIPVILSMPEICSGENINLNIDSIPNATYQWSGPNNFTSNNQNINIENSSTENSGLYTVKVTLNGCESSANYSLNVNPTPNFTIEFGCLNSIFTLNVVPTENSFIADEVTYNWTGPNGFTSSLNPINLSGLPSGIYQITITNSLNCSLKKEVNVINTLCNITNVITPNNDGSNEFFDLSGLDVSNLQIFSRWGRLVYEKNNYTNQWSGQNMHNGRLPDSTYYYFVRLTSGEELHGWILLAYNSN